MKHHHDSEQMVKVPIEFKINIFEHNETKYLRNYLNLGTNGQGTNRVQDKYF